MFILLTFVIKLYITVITHALWLPVKCLFRSPVNHTYNYIVHIISSFGCSCKGQGPLKLPKYCSEILTFECCKKHSKVGTFEGLFESSTFVYALVPTLDAVQHKSLLNTWLADDKPLVCA